MGSLTDFNTKRQGLNEPLQALLAAFCDMLSSQTAVWQGCHSCPVLWCLKFVAKGMRRHCCGLTPVCSLKAYVLGLVPRVVLAGGRGTFKRWDVEGGP